MKMQWRSGQPIDMGYYLCAVVGNNKPTELYWDGRFWGYYSFDGWITSEDAIAYYMYLGDIPMPEGW
jgi:hypothetical protein